LIPIDSANSLLSTPKPEEPLTLDINRSSEEDWQRLRGIGPTYARRIVHFREKLGGFSSIEQVGETYNLPDSVFQKIRPHLQPSPIFRPLPLNRADFETLNAHPYIRYRQARFLVRYREQHGPIPNAAAFRKAAYGVFSESEIERLLPYLDFK
ncbi:MAG: helix-hairpin-helix domain-containing protein, partial [Bacteroidetes bacterium]